MGPDDEVIVPTWTFAASAEVVAYLGARPVLVDVDARTLNASPETILSAVTARTKAVVVVHFGGLPVEIETITRLLEARGIPVVEDVAHAFPSRIGGPDGRYAGTFGRAGAYSFYATKTITTAEGGMLVTDDDAVAAGRGSWGCTASAVTPGSAIPRADPGTTRSRTPGTSTT